MQIKRVQIDDFGQWQNKTFDFTSGLQVVAGLNGSGKTTLHRFILGMLFGFPRAKGRYVNTYESQKTGRYGGTLWFTQGQESYELSRHGRTKSKVTLINTETGQGFADPEQKLLACFAPLTAELYQTIYDFDQDNLLAVFQLTPAKFLATMRTIGLPKAQAWLKLADDWDKEAQAALGMTQQAKRPLNQALQQLREDKQRLQAAMVQRPALTSLEQAIQADQVALKEANQEQQAVQTAKQLAPLEAELRSLSTWLDEQPTIMSQDLVNAIQQDQAQLTYLKQAQVDLVNSSAIKQGITDWAKATEHVAPSKQVSTWFGYGVAALILLASLALQRAGLGLLLAGALIVMTWLSSQQKTATAAGKPGSRQAVNWEQKLKHLGFDVKGLTPAEALSKYEQQLQEQLRLREQAVTIQAKLLSHYQAVQVTNEDGFKQRLQIDQATQTAKTRVDLLKSQITALKATQRESATSHDALSADEMAQLQTRLASARLKKDAYLSDNQFQALRQQIVMEQTRLMNGLQDYFTARLAAKWIRMTLDQANADRWPQLIARTNDLVRTLTQGQLVSVDWQEKTFRVLDAQGQRLSLIELSRATAEQVYLALRLALIEQTPSRGVLPLLIDDAFVDFDDPRRASLMTVLQSFAEKGHQIIYFTKTTPDGLTGIQLTN
ncbi:ATP-binding protein [Weissella halotolerans]|uniref:Rad50/SbcC-type AAA domain-containing protein n=1 Tax=Weissella halotolerans DSM 20190 TaxID=1123500 RepID=A0A0R2G1J4_9LACO|nr:AAA family ATPase [Weissella halotolerans]KRN33318.1 hypothetical protein IV68_GL000116 [Weissella halotolerans DSM 20190]